MTGTPHPNRAVPRDDLDGLLATDPLAWARHVPVLVYDRHAAPIAARADPVRDAVDAIRHRHTNYDDLVADVVAHYGRYRRDDIVGLLRTRVLRALAFRYPRLAPACRNLAALSIPIENSPDTPK